MNIMHVSADAKYNLFHRKLTAYEGRSTTTEMEIFQTLHKSKPTASGLDSLPACCLVWQHRLLQTAAPMIADLTCCFIYPASQCEVDVKSLVYTGYVQLPNKISEVLAQPIVSKNQVCSIICFILLSLLPLNTP